MDNKYKYHVAISFAEEDRNAALALALALELKGVKNIYYYPDKQVGNAGKKLEKELMKVYSEETRYTVVLLSKKYFKKPTARFELKLIYARMSRESEFVTVIPVKLQEGLSLEEHKLLKKLQWLTWDFNPKKIAEDLLIKLGTHIIPIKKEIEKATKGKKISIRQKNKSENAHIQSNNAVVN